MNTPLIMDFLTELQQNNTLEWMKENKEAATAAKLEFENLVEAFIARLSEFDPSVGSRQARDLTFRLNRDTRFSKDKSPYRAAFRAHISSAGKLPIPAGYFLNLAPGGSFLGGGVFASQFPQATEMVRSYLVSHDGEFMKIVSHPDFAENFTVIGEALKRVPKGFDEAHPLAEYLKHKAWAVEYHVSDEQVRDGERFLDAAVELFRKMKPFNDYLNAALTDFVMPRR